MKHKLSLILLITILNTCAVFSQVLSINGYVTDNNGDALPGVTIIQKESANGTISSMDGSFTISVQPGSTLVFSFIGMKTKEIPVVNETILNIKLEPGDVFLDEVIVVGYGELKRSDVTGSVTSIKPEDASRIPSTNVAEMLRGKVPGLNVTLGSASPGGSSEYVLRGKKSLSGSNSALIILDGVPVDDINDVNSSDIESIEVLKDASSQAIYGARASNGVIYITTKRGVSGKTTVDFDSYVGVQQLQKNFDLFNGNEWADYRREAFRSNNTGTNPYGEYVSDETVFNPTMLEVLQSENFVDWEDLVLQNATTQSYNLKVNGGNDKTRIAVSFGRFSQDGLIPNTLFKRNLVRLNVDHNLSKNISLGINSYYKKSIKKDDPNNNLNFILIPPLAKPYFDDGTINPWPAGESNTSGYYNPLHGIQESDNSDEDMSCLINAFLDIKILKDLKYTLNTSMTSRYSQENTYYSSQHKSGVSSKGIASFNSGDSFEYLVENILTYKKNFTENQKFHLTLMQSVNEKNANSYSMKGSGFDTDALGYYGIAGASNQEITGRGAIRKAMTSYMGRLRYSAFDKYLLTLTMRADGSSVFSENNKWGYFPSVAFAWRIDQEDFISNVQWLNSLKYRLSYGSTGNQAISAYQTLGIASSDAYIFGGMPVVGYLPDNELPNPDLKWETSTTLNTGFDFALFNSRIYGTAEYYRTNTTDLLVSKSISAPGYSSILINMGRVRNSGLDFSLTGRPIKTGETEWILGFNYSYNKNEIVELYDGLQEDINNNWYVGQPIDIYRDYSFDGIWQLSDDRNGDGLVDNPLHMPGSKPGYVKVKDMDNNSTLDQNDKIFYQKDPKHILSLSSTIRYKGFELYGDLFAKIGSYKRNDYLYEYESGGELRGMYNGIKVDYWTPENPSNTAPRPNYGGLGLNDINVALAYQDNSYIRLRTLTLGYIFDNELLSFIKLNQLKVYVTGYNLFTKTDYLSYSPERSAGSYPEAKSFIFGVKASF